jgi:hypothetical protein
MRTYEVKDWLKTLNIATHYYSGKIDNTQEKAVCVYDDRMDESSEFVAIGGYKYTKTHTFKASAVLQWNDMPRETEDAGYEFMDKLKKIADGGGFYIGKHLVQHLIPIKHIYIGTNESGLCQRLIYFDIIYTD